MSLDVIGVVKARMTHLPVPRCRRCVHVARLFHDNEKHDIAKPLLALLLLINPSRYYTANQHRYGVSVGSHTVGEQEQEVNQLLAC